MDIPYLDISLPQILPFLSTTSSSANPITVYSSLRLNRYLSISTMKTFIAVASLFSLALALPAVEQRQAAVCSGTYGNAQCCATNVLNLADLNCNNRT